MILHHFVFCSRFQYLLGFFLSPIVLQWTFCNLIHFHTHQEGFKALCLFFCNKDPTSSPFQMNSCVLLTNLWSLHFYPLFHNLQLLIIPLSCTSPPGFIHLLPTHFIQRPPMYMHLVLFPSALHFFPNGSLNHLPYLTALVAFVILLISHSVVSTFTPSPSINPFSIYSCHANPPFSLLYQA